MKLSTARWVQSSLIKVINKRLLNLIPMHLKFSCNEIISESDVHEINHMNCGNEIK